MIRIVCCFGITLRMMAICCVCFLDRAPTKCFKLRWGTVLRATHDVLTMRASLEVAFDVDMIPQTCQDRLLVQKLIDDKVFWSKARAVATIGEDIEVERRWLHGCKCHPEENKEAARKGTLFKCPNNQKGKRGPELRLKLAEAFDRWQHNQANCHFSDTDDPTGEVYSGLHGAYSCLLGLARQK